LNENIVQKDMESEYDNSGRVENSSQLIADFISDAADYRHEVASLVDFGQSYGSKERNKLDLFWPGDDKPDKTAPIVMFIHGGYWQRLDRSAFSHMAKGLNARAIAVAIPSYTLCPNITISGIIDEIRRACIVLWKTHDRQIIVCGHSAGGHLAACMLATNWDKIHPSLPIDLVPAALSISGVFELAPLIETSLNQALKLPPEEARTASPYNWIIDQGLRFDAWVGGNESSEFIRQSRSQVQRWKMMGALTRFQAIAGANHFTAVDPLTDPNSLMVKRLLELLEPVKETTLDDLNIPVHTPRPIDERPIAASDSQEETQDNTNEDANNSLKSAKDTNKQSKVVSSEEDSGQDTSPADEATSKSEQQNDTASPNAAKQGLDDLTIINGIGDVLQDRLRNLGFSTYEHLAELSEAEKEMIEDTLDFKGRIDRDHWKTQARHQKAIKELASS
jgi:arylformamidase